MCSHSAAGFTASTPTLSFSLSLSDSSQSHEILKPLKRDYLKTILYIQRGSRDCQLQQKTQRDTTTLTPLSYCLYLTLSLSCFPTLCIIVISISKIISLWVMHCRHSGEFVITWLWNRGNSASPCRTQFRVVARHFASRKHTVTHMQRNECGGMFARTSKMRWKCTDVCGEIGSLQQETLTGFSTK